MIWEDLDDSVSPKLPSISESSLSAEAALPSTFKEAIFFFFAFVKIPITNSSESYLTRENHSYYAHLPQLLIISWSQLEAELSVPQGDNYKLKF